MIPADHFREITPHLFVWEVFDPAVKCELTSTAIVTAGECVFVDPIPLAEEPLADLCSRGRPSAILLTSANHARAAADYREKWDIPVWAPADAVSSLEVTVDCPFTDGEPLPADLTSVRLPAAGPGEVAFIGRDFVCLGDAVINLPRQPFSLLAPKYCRDVARLPNQLTKLMAYDFHILTFAHGAPLVEQAKQRLQQLLA